MSSKKEEGESKSKTKSKTKTVLKSWVDRLVKANKSKDGSAKDGVQEVQESLDLSYCPGVTDVDIEQHSSCLYELCATFCHLQSVPKVYYYYCIEDETGPYSRSFSCLQEVFRCSELRVLDLADNDLHECPPAIASLLSLTDLYLERNGK